MKEEIEKSYFRVKEFADMANYSKESIYKYCENGEIEHIKRGKTILIKNSPANIQWAYRIKSDRIFDLSKTILPHLVSKMSIGYELPSPESIANRALDIAEALHAEAEKRKMI